jgi:hypothetical protein
MRHQLFTQNGWSIVAAHQRSVLDEAISNTDDEHLLTTPIHELCLYFAERCKFVIPTLHRDDIVVDQRETQIDIISNRTRYVRDRSHPLMVKGTLVEVFIPFDGNGECFDIQPTTFTFNLPHAEIRENTLVLHIEGIDLVAEKVRTQIQNTLNEIDQNLRYLQSDVNRFNGNLYSYAHALVEQRRKKLASGRSLVSDLGFKLKDARPEITQEIKPEAMPEQRYTLTLLPSATNSAQKPEPILPLMDYAHILEALEKTAMVVLHSPSLLATIDESAIRTHFLFQLNGLFAAQPGSETFTAGGKSAIYMYTQGKSLFIAEFGFWLGLARLVESLEQLLDYEAWRDVKATIVLFNLNQDHAQIYEYIRQAVRSHSRFKRELPQLSETTLPYIFTHRNDPDKEMLLTILAFHVPQPIAKSPQNSDSQTESKDSLL